MKPILSPYIQWVFISYTYSSFRLEKNCPFSSNHWALMWYLFLQEQYLANALLYTGFIGCFYIGIINSVRELWRWLIVLWHFDKHLILFYLILNSATLYLVLHLYAFSEKTCSHLVCDTFSGHHLKLYKHQCRLQVRANFFTNRIVNVYQLKWFQQQLYLCWGKTWQFVVSPRTWIWTKA